MVAGRAKRPLPAGRQRGAIGLFGIVTLLLALMFAALAIDAGRLWMDNRQLQTVADMAALEAAGTIGALGCKADSLAVLAAAQTAAQRNGYSDSLTSAPNRLEIGQVQTDKGERLFIAGTGEEAVHVVATRSVPASLLLGGLLGNQIVLTAEATARADPIQASFGTGSALLRVSVSEQDKNLFNLLLGSLLGGSLSLDAVSYQALAGANVTLLELLQASTSVGSVEELLNANLTVRDVIEVTRGAVSLHDSGQSTAAEALSAILDANISALDVRLGDVLKVATPVTDAASNLNINVLDLITASLMLANQNHAISLPLGISIPGVSSLSTEINIIEPPQIAVGPAGHDTAGNWCTEAKTAQINVGVTSSINVIGLATVKLKLAMDVAQGSAHLKTLVSEASTAQAVIGASPGIASIKLTNTAGTGPAVVTLLLGLIPLAEIGINLEAQANPSDLSYNLVRPVDSMLPATETIASPLGGSLTNALTAPGVVQVRMLGLDTGGIMNALLGNILGPLLGQIGGQLLDPLLKLLGMQFGELDVTLHHIKYRGGAQLVI